MLPGQRELASVATEEGRKSSQHPPMFRNPPASFPHSSNLRNRQHPYTAGPARLTPSDCWHPPPALPIPREWKRGRGRRVHVGIPKRVPASIVEIQFEFPLQADGTGKDLHVGITVLAATAPFTRNCPRRLSVNALRWTKPTFTSGLPSALRNGRAYVISTVQQRSDQV